MSLFFSFYRTFNTKIQPLYDFRSGHFLCINIMGWGKRSRKLGNSHCDEVWENPEISTFLGCFEILWHKIFDYLWKGIEWWQKKTWLLHILRHQSHLFIFQMNGWPFECSKKRHIDEWQMTRANACPLTSFYVYTDKIYRCVAFSILRVEFLLFA